jgi:predicted kinase
MPRGCPRQDRLTAAVQSPTPAAREPERLPQYLELAGAFLRPAPAQLIAIGGFSGSGKSTLARGLAPGVGAAPGALVVRSDLLRKSMMAVTPLAPLDDAGYTPAVTRRVYRELTARAVAALKAGHSVIADAGLRGRKIETRLPRRQAWLACRFCWLDAPLAILAQRTPIGHSTRRRHGPSSTIRSAPTGAIAWQRLDGGGYRTVLQHARRCS